MINYFLYALLSGLLLGFAWPTNGLEFLAFIAWVPLLLAEHHLQKFSNLKSKTFKVFLLSFFSFCVWNLIATGWLYESRNPDGSHSIFAVLAPVFINSLAMATAFWSYSFFKKIMGTYWSFPYLLVLWLCFEKMHLEWELTWPWLNLGNVFSEKITWIQWYEYTGTFGGTLWILVANLMFFYTIRVFQASRDRKMLYKNIAIALGIIILPILASKIRFNSINQVPKANVKTLLLQPALDPYGEKYTFDSLQILQNLIDITDKSTELGYKFDYILAPETAIPGNGHFNEKNFEKSEMLNRIRMFLSVHPKTVFVTGASTYQNYEENNKSKSAFFNPYSLRWMDFYNSVLQIAPGAKTLVYHKSKLVPGAEIFPYQKLLEPLLGDLMLDFGGATLTLGTDPDRMVFRNPYNKAVVAPIVCYESVYGEHVGRYVQKGANLLMVSTNDSWWGVSQGHKQLLSYARLRAIETRRSLVRSANSGVSAQINYKGEIIKQLPYLQKGALATNVELYEELTFYVKYGDLIVRMSMFLLGLFWAILISKIILRKKDKKLAQIKK